ncbi:hypothetical protein BW716_03730 [[Flexibacter] sp. ATCC 35208]|nr:hypothetical protein BW716_03730 [[Flexibacter] sp. ATCC 35208]
MKSGDHNWTKNRRLKWMKFWRRQLDENKVEIRVKMDEIQGEMDEKLGGIMDEISGVNWMKLLEVTME